VSFGGNRGQGRTQAYRTLYEKAPTTSWSLEELRHLASVTLANLPIGECIIKIGRRPPARVQALALDPVVVDPEHLAKVGYEIAVATPFRLSKLQAQMMYNDFREALDEKLEKRPGDEEDEGDSDE